MVQVLSGAGAVRLTQMNAVMQDGRVVPIATRLDATLVDTRGGMRVVQHSFSAILVQAVLGAMVVLLLAGLTTWRRLGQLVRNNPCCSAGGLGLFAGSRYVVGGSAGGKFEDEKMSFALGW